MTGYVATTVTFLETTAPPKGPPLQPPDGVGIVRVLEPTVAFWRFLYETVGEPWLWTEQSLEDDAAILARIRRSGCDLRVLWRHGQPAGFAELHLADGEAELVFFGILPDFVGQGLGRYLLDWTVRHAFAKGAARLWLHTCDLDHPAALANYEARGFEAFDREADEVPVIEGMALPAHARDRPIRPA